MDANDRAEAAQAHFDQWSEYGSQILETARFERPFSITEEEFGWLAGQVESLKRMTGDACRKRIAAFGGG